MFATEGPGALADAVLRSCGGGSLLVVGRDPLPVVECLLRAGADAWGVDVNPGGRAGARVAPGSPTGLAWPAERFDTVACVDLLHRLDEDERDAAIDELVRVTRRSWFATVGPGAAPASRHAWEARLIAAGLRKHPRQLVATPFESIERDEIDGRATLVCEKRPAADPPRDLDPELHRDMLAQPGRRSDAHVARYQLAASVVRRGDRVLDVGCGLGYGTAVLAHGSLSREAIGLDASEEAVRYARSHYASERPSIAFHVGEAGDLSLLEDESVDVVVAFELLEHLRESGPFLGESLRVLKPGGRIVVSVPNDWSDDTGADPNPHHLRVYDWERLGAELRERFGLERGFAQIGGGAGAFADRARQLREIDVGGPPRCDAEWWIAIGWKDPVGATADRFVETFYPEPADGTDCDLTAFARDYDNPWLPRALVTGGLRADNDALLEDAAERASATSTPGSADAGAALCVRGYRLLESDTVDDTEVDALQREIAAFSDRAQDTPHAWRWRISNAFLDAQLHLRAGRRERARSAFVACTGIDPLSFGPPIATKTVGAWYAAGLIAAEDGDRDGAADAWRRGVEAARRALSGSWRNIVGSTDAPVSFGLSEVAEMLELASRCADALLVVDEWSSRPGAVRELAAGADWAGRQSVVRELESQIRWLDAERRDAAAEAPLSSRASAELLALREAYAHQRSWIGQQAESIRWLSGQREELIELKREREVHIEQLQKWIDEQARAIGWLNEQRDALLARLAEDESEPGS